MITRINELNHEMALLLDRLKNEEVPPQVAGEMNRTFANMIRSCQVQINYALARGEKPVITMLDDKAAVNSNVNAHNKRIAA